MTRVPHEKISVIIPACNEAATLPEIVERVRATGLVSEIIVVDDGSTDDSATVLTRLKNSGQPELRVLRHPRNRGKGAAIRTGLAEVTGAITLVQDADLEYNPQEYPALLAPFSEADVEAVYGSRNLRPNLRSTQMFYWGGRFLSWTTNLLYRSRLTDEATGYKVIRTPLLRALNLHEDGFEFCPELTGKLLRRGIRIREVPISYQPRSWADGKKIRWHHGVTAVWTLLKYRFGPQNARHPSS